MYAALSAKAPARIRTLLPHKALAPGRAGGHAVFAMEETPNLRPELFEPVRGRRARRHRMTGEIWQMDLLHSDHWEVYKTVKDFEQGSRDRSIWSDGRLKDKF